MNDEPETCTNCENPMFDEGQIIKDADSYPYCSEECRDEYLEGDDVDIDWSRRHTTRFKDCFSSCDSIEYHKAGLLREKLNTY